MWPSTLAVLWHAVANNGEDIASLRAPRLRSPLHHLTFILSTGDIHAGGKYVHCVQTVKDQDLELMDEVSNLVQKKAQMMAHLKALLDEALSDTHKNSDGNFKEEFQQVYAGKVAEVRITRCPGGMHVLWL